MRPLFDNSDRLLLDTPGVARCLTTFAACLGGELTILGERSLLSRDALPALAGDFALTISVH